MRSFRLYVTIWIVCCTCLLAQGQHDILHTYIDISEAHNLKFRKDYLKYISDTYGWVFSYNANTIDVEAIVHSDIKSSRLQFVLEQIFQPDLISCTVSLPDKIILQNLQKKPGDVYRLSGIVKDVETGEAIYGAFVFEANSRISAITNEKGYFVIDLPFRNVRIEVNYLGYKKSIYSAIIDKRKFIQIEMTGSNYLDTIHVHNPTSRLQYADGGNLMDAFSIQRNLTVSGETDIVANARVVPGVVSGGEGLSGLYVRGGTPDQNLTMIDGVAMYETSHLLGITSIFMDESVKEASFIKNGFPARYGGRISSVLDIQLKEGDKTKNNTSVTVGLSGLNVHFNGPVIKDKLTYSVSMRSSWLNFYVNNIIKKYTKYDDIDIKYHDIMGKFTYHFSGNNSLSLSLYNGGDHFFLTKSNTLINNQENYTLKVFDRNGIGWTNRVGSLKWNYLAGDKLSIKVQSGFIKYSNNARSSYIFNNILSDTSKVDQLDVLTQTHIQDINARADADYYFNDNHIFRSGVNVVRQVFNPTVKQSTIILKDEAENITDKDSSISTYNIQYYLEDNFKWNDKLFIYGGLHLSTYKLERKSYISLQPRLKLIWSITDNQMISVSYSRMTQFVHLLSSSGLGLPSNLWVPSTEKIRPLNANQWSAGYTLNIGKSAYVQFGAYSRTISNILEYTTPIDMFYFLINDQNISTIVNSARDWERNVYSGNGMSKGLEFLVHKTSGRLTGWLSATRSVTTRNFKEINKGKSFPAAHDKPWNTNVGFNYRFSSHWNAGANFVYNTGNAFSLSTEEYDSYLGIKLLNSDGKNNYRLPDFHQLSMNVMYSRKGKLMDTEVAFKLYNVYNRLNAYYIYIYKSSLVPEAPVLRKVSILPVTPSLSIKINF